MIQVRKILPAPAIFDKPFMVMMPNKSKGSGVVAPYLFDTREEAQKFLDAAEESLQKYWWDKE